MNKHEFDFILVHPEMIRVDTKYQRVLDERRVKKIVTNWKDDLVNPPKVSLRKDGFYYVFDGQHTLESWKIKYKGSPIMCQVYHDLTWAEEKDLFVEQRGYCKDPSTNDKLHAAYEAGQEDVVDMVHCATVVGFRMDFKPGTSTFKITATSAAYDVYKDVGRDTFINILTVLKEIWHGDKSSTDASVLRGFAILYKNYGYQFTNGQLIKSLSSITIPELKQNSRKYGGKPIAFTYALIDQYNWKKRTNKISANYVSLM